jgi:cytochrome oxidase Cu insertion factor (SCO1/SenC/PrrC family)
MIKIGLILLISLYLVQGFVHHRSARISSSRRNFQLQDNKKSFNAFTKALFSAALSGMVAIGTPALSFADAIPLVGATAPDFNLPSNAGKSFSLEDLKGKWTVLYFYPV